MHAAQDPSRTTSRWQDAADAAHYADERFAGGHAERDLRLASHLIRRFDGAHRTRELLDVPAGTGRLHDGLERLSDELLGADVSAAMLALSPYAPRHRALIADARRLPLRDGSVDVVVACRLLHHLDDDETTRALSEFLRVSRRLVVASFWDAACWTETRKRLGWRGRTDARRAISRAHLAQLTQAAGGRVLGHASSFRFFSPQTFVALRPQDR